MKNKMPTSFQTRVYELVKKIPKGKVSTYKAIAEKLNSSPRAVGQALKKNYNKNIPCHRVIHINGEIGNYNRGKKRKTELLKEEGYLT